MNILQRLKAPLEQFFIKDIEKSVSEQTSWDWKEQVWYGRLNDDPSVSQWSVEEVFVDYFKTKEFKILKEQDGRVTAKQELPDKNRTICAHFVDPKNPSTRTEETNMKEKEGDHWKTWLDEKRLEVRIMNEGSTLEYFEQALNEFAEQLAKYTMLNGQKFNNQVLKQLEKLRDDAQKQQAVAQEQQLAQVVEQNTVFQSSPSFLMVIFLSKIPSKEDVKQILMEHCSAKGLTCKLQGSATVKGANSSLFIEMKIGYNDANERMIHCLNQVSFLGGDKSGKLFQTFARELAYKLAKLNYLDGQDPPIPISRPALPPDKNAGKDPNKPKKEGEQWTDISI